jgi:glycosyltransferase involved in cell wall biosynthesis
VSRADDAARRVLRGVRAARQRQAGLPPRLRVASQSGPPVVYYLCPDSDRPTGGIRAIYRHVDVLNAAGIDAAVVHDRDGFCCTWFAHQTRVTSARRAVLSPQDILVVPEWYGRGLARLPDGPRVVIFNQNAYMTFAGLDDAAPAGAPYRGVPGLEAVVVVSGDNADYLRFAFPDLRVSIVRNAIDPSLFHPGGRQPGRRLAVMPRKRRDDLRQVLRLLTARGSLDGWDVVTIDNRAESETASLLRSCAIFLSFSEYEGFGLPPAEAMACGCYVVGFSGLGGREYFLPDFSSPVAENDLVAFARAAESALGSGPDELARLGRMASDYVLARYSPQAQQDDLLAFFLPLFKE